MYHHQHGGPYPLAQGTQYADKHADGRAPPQEPFTNLGPQYAQSLAQDLSMQNNAQVNFVQPSQNQPSQSYNQENPNYPPNVVK